MYEREITIGDGNKLNSTVVCFKIKGDHSISENANCYWISNLILDFKMVIFKNTTEGITLTNMIENEESFDSILDFLHKVLMKYLVTRNRVDVLLIAIENTIQYEKDKAFDEGRDSIKKAIKTLLDIKR